ncbi:glycosyltransferase family 4 protein [Variovorax sp. J22G21]|uniref:glycosyltransferase family 4 protein n=1 Tax=Variovorax fucosicus TaxID=3053517 RepID=UPI0025781CAA|nr:MULTISPECIES: glycosyltransferase family 4 protein [unclassified Variovorax]MDM0039008.1 glycosyltransferase family 4 protein [Variovorax sp. J22R193]MDM0063784.1 glycosyltransferase family 4 protein [Variovorax sp. J22G21]
MTAACFFLVPGDWNAATGGYGYDRRIAAGLRGAGWAVDVRSPGDAFPLPDAATLDRARDVIAALPDHALVVADGLAFGALPELVEAHARRLRWVALVHHPLSFEAGLPDDVRHRLFDSERRALVHARHVVVTSPSTARALGAFGVAPSRVTVIEPGTEAAPLATGGGAGAQALYLLCVATVTTRKGHAVLIEALAGLADRSWTLHCAGSLARDAAAVAAVQALVAQHGLQDRIVWHGEVDGARLDGLYAQADLFVLPSFHEGYGMALAEALVRGLPVVSCAAGAIPDTVPPAAGLLVPPGDAAALQAALQRVMDEAGLRTALAAGARAAGAQLPTWPQAVARFATVLHQVGEATAP